MVSERRKKQRDPLRRPKPEIVPTELPVFGELERLGLVVPVSAERRQKRPARSPKR